MARYNCRNGHAWSGVSNLSEKFDPAKDLVCSECSAPAEPKMKRGAPMRRVSERNAEKVRRQGSTLKRGKGFEASPAQRAKVKGMSCVGCGREESPVLVIDPMHLWPRRKGGCDSPDCVAPGCRRVGGFDSLSEPDPGCHPLFEEGKLSLLERLADSEAWAVEQAHPILCHGVSVVELARELASNAHELVWVEREAGVSAP